jgi:hypothetical protein
MSAAIEIANRSSDQRRTVAEGEHVRLTPVRRRARRNEDSDAHRRVPRRRNAWAEGGQADADRDAAARRALTARAVVVTRDARRVVRVGRGRHFVVPRVRHLRGPHRRTAVPHVAGVHPSADMHHADSVRLGAVAAVAAM